MEIVVRQDLEDALAEYWDRVKIIDQADADLSARQEGVVDEVILLISKFRVPPARLKKQFEAIYNNLTELTARD